MISIMVHLSLVWLIYYVSVIYMSASWRNVMLKSEVVTDSFDTNSFSLSSPLTLVPVSENYLSVLNGSLLSSIVPISLGGTGARHVEESRRNLELGNSATQNIGTTYGTVCAGDDPRLRIITNGHLCVDSATIKELTVTNLNTTDITYINLNTQDLTLTGTLYVKSDYHEYCVLKVDDSTVEMRGKFNIFPDELDRYVTQADAEASDLKKGDVFIVAPVDAEVGQLMIKL